MVLPARKHPRLKNYDYRQNGCYHLTICVKDRQPILSRVIPADNPALRPQIEYSNTGKIVDQYIQNIPMVYPGVSLDHYVIMPNHVHLLLTLPVQNVTPVSTIIRSLKRMVNKALGQSIWQDSFFDVVIRSNSMYQCEWAYIDNNPDKWSEDELYIP